MSGMQDNYKLNMSSAEFKEAGYLLVDIIAQFLQELPSKKVKPDKGPSEIKKLLHHISYDNGGTDTQQILKEAAELLFENSLFNGHPRFWGYITSSAAPVGALADMLASAVNANVGAFELSPMATEIENQTINWLADFIDYSPDCGGLFVSGGNVANFIGVLTARRKMIPPVREKGLGCNFKNLSKKPFSEGEENNISPKLLMYCANGTHTWVQKAADLFGHGTDSIRWISCDDSMRMNVAELEQQISKDKKEGHLPFIVIGNAGTVSTGSIDRLDEIAGICKAANIWFHIDGAYGAPAAGLEELKEAFRGLKNADSIAFDPHKWLYAPLEAGCILVKDRSELQNTFSYNPEYYNFEGDSEDKPVNFHDYGLQNSRGFRALKVWMSMRQVGKTGFKEMIRDNILLAKRLFQLADENDDLQPVTHNLSITTFQFLPKNLDLRNDGEYINELNEKLLHELQKGGEFYLSHAIIDGKYCLRVCIVNFRTSLRDLEALITMVVQKGRLLHESTALN